MWAITASMGAFAGDMCATIVSMWDVEGDVWDIAVPIRDVVSMWEPNGMISPARGKTLKIGLLCLGKLRKIALLRSENLLLICIRC